MEDVAIFCVQVSACQRIFLPPDPMWGIKGPGKGFPEMETVSRVSDHCSPVKCLREPILTPV